MKNVHVKCGKCGTINEKKDGQCNECGDYLFQYYVKQKRQYQFNIIAGLACLFITLFFLGAYINNQLKDPIKDDLKQYLSEMINADKILNSSTEYHSYSRVILGSPSSEDELVILSKLGFEKEPPLTEIDQYTKYNDALKNYMKTVRKKHSFREQSKLKLKYYTLQYDTYSRITPLTESVSNIHNKLVEAHQKLRDAESNFGIGMDLNFITQVKIPPEGGLQWMSSRVTPEYSEKYLALSEKSEKLSEEYKRELTQICEQKELMEEYKKLFWYDAIMKEALKRD